MIAFAYISLILTALSCVLGIAEYANKGQSPVHVFVGMGWLFITLIGIVAVYWR